MDDSHTNRLLHIKTLIATTLREHNETIQTVKTSTKTTEQDLLKIAKGIQLNCHAPNEYKIGMQLFNCHPPAPQPEEMRAGELAVHHTKSRQQKATMKGDLEILINKICNPGELLDSLRNEVGRKRNMEAMLQENTGIRETLSHAVSENTLREDMLVETVVNKKSRSVNISFGLSDSEGSSSDEE